MNLTQFMQKIDSLTEKAEQPQLALFVHQLARTQPEWQREKFLESLESIVGCAKTESMEEKYADSDKMWSKDLDERLEKIWKELEKIETGEVALDSELNDTYDSWYDDFNDEFCFSDPQNLTGTIEEACDLVHECADCELFQEGYRLANMLLGMNILVEGDYLEYNGDQNTIHDLKWMGYDSVDFERLTMDAIYLAYRGTILKDRPETIFQILRSSGCASGMKLEAVLQNCPTELEDIQDFLKLWIEYLGEREGDLEKQFLLEALELQNDAGAALDAARRFCSKHPGIYKSILSRGRDGDENEKMYEIGCEALKKIEPKYKIRGEIALLTAVFALRLNRQDEAEMCWMEAFRSGTKLVNYMRLVTNCRDFSKYETEVTSIVKGVFAESSKDAEYQPGYLRRGQEFRQNSISRIEFLVFQFLDGKFKKTLEDGMSKTQPLGWSSTFMKEGISLFLLYLYQGEALNTGCRSMCQRIVSETLFNAERYADGLLQMEEKQTDAELFWHCFLSWKENRLKNHTDRLDQDQLLEKLEQWIAMRVEAILKGKYRGHYGDCAAFIAALGEVRESMGRIGAKAAIMEKYRSMYSRHTAFHKELRAYGMRR